MVVLGIDPGTTSIGYAIMDCPGRSPVFKHAGVFRIESPNNQGRLGELHERLNRIIIQWHPRILAVERLYFAKNTKTAIAVSESRGAILLTAVLSGLTVHEYTPLEVKKIVTGDGRADKIQIQKMISLTVPGTESLPHQDDMFDAIAVALAWAHTQKVFFRQK